MYLNYLKKYYNNIKNREKHKIKTQFSLTKLS